MERVLADARPDVVLVHGDTTTSTAAALAAFYQQIPVGHVEAGLRTKNRWLPYPEEMNRRLTAAIASYHFAPTTLARESSSGRKRRPSGHLRHRQHGHRRVSGDGEPGGPPARRVGMKSIRRGRRSSSPRIAARTTRICARFARRCGRSPNRPPRPQLYWPVHPSPRVAPIAHEVLDGVRGVVLVEPIDYAEMVAAVKESCFVLTDSGGLQEEAPCLGKPVLVMRDETERPEGITAGTLRARRAPAARDRGGSATPADRRTAYATMAHAVNPYGDGRGRRANRGVAAGATAGRSISAAVLGELPVRAANASA